MFRTTYPQEALGRAHNLIGAYETAHAGLAGIAREFRSELHATLDRLGPRAALYLQTVRRDLEGRSREASNRAPLWIDRLTDPMTDRRILASRALLHAVDDEADARGVTL